MGTVQDTTLNGSLERGWDQGSEFRSELAERGPLPILTLWVRIQTPPLNNLSKLLDFI